MKLAAVIFDLNGTVLEDEDEYGKAFVKVLKGLGVDAKDQYPQEKGIGVEENWKKLIDKYQIKTDKTLSALVMETQEAYISTISSVVIREGFEEFVEKLRDSQVQIGLATSNTWEQTDKILDVLNLQGLFDSTTTGDEVVYNKPDPDIFIISADKLGVERGNCLVIEDSQAGIEAARRAGMKVIGIVNEDDTKDLVNADALVGGFSEITAQMIEEL